MRERTGLHPAAGASAAIVLVRLPVPRQIPARAVRAIAITVTLSKVPLQPCSPFHSGALAPMFVQFVGK